MAHDRHLQFYIPTGKGPLVIPDRGLTQPADVTLYDEILIEAKGYDGPVPAKHKSTVVHGLYERETLAEINGRESISVREYIAGGFVVTHTMRLPTAEELAKFRVKQGTFGLKPGKRRANRGGKQRHLQLVTRSTLRLAVDTYDLMLQSVDGVKLINGDTPTIGQCIELVDPLIKRLVVNVAMGLD